MDAKIAKLKQLKKRKDQIDTEILKLRAEIVDSLAGTGIPAAWSEKDLLFPIEKVPMPPTPVWTPSIPPYVATSSNLKTLC